MDDLAKKQLFWVRVEQTVEMLVLAVDAKDAKQVAVENAGDALDDIELSVDRPRPLADSQMNACPVSEMVWGYDGTLGEYLDHLSREQVDREPVVLDSPNQESLF